MAYRGTERLRKQDGLEKTSSQRPFGRPIARLRRIIRAAVLFCQVRLRALASRLPDPFFLKRPFGRGIHAALLGREALGSNWFSFDCRRSLDHDQQQKHDPTEITAFAQDHPPRIAKNGKDSRSSFATASGCGTKAQSKRVNSIQQLTCDCQYLDHQPIARSCAPQTCFARAASAPIPDSCTKVGLDSLWEQDCAGLGLWTEGGAW
jgi:hypothetical protein